MRKKANKLVAAKVKLAASVDVIGGKLEGGYGESVRKDIQQKLDTLAAPSKGRTKKALPAPLEKARKRRGGKRARKFKEMNEQTEMRKLLNRTAFGSANDAGYADDAMGVDFGMCKDGGGKVRELLWSLCVCVCMSICVKLFVLEIPDVLYPSPSYYVLIGSYGPNEGTEAQCEEDEVEQRKCWRFNLQEWFRDFNSIHTSARIRVGGPNREGCQDQAADDKYFSHTSGFMSVMKK